MRRKIMFLVACSMLVLFCGRAFAEETVLLDFEDDKPLGVKSKFLNVNNKYCNGKTEVVAGMTGEKAVKISFGEKTDKLGGRWCDFTGAGVKKMGTGKWAEKNYRVLKFWVKGDGSMNVVGFKIEYWKKGEKTQNIHFETFSLEDPEWKQVVISLDSIYQSKMTEKPNSCAFYFGENDEEFYFVIDQITIEDESPVL